MSTEELALIGIRTGALAYAGLSIFFIVGWTRRISGRAALAAAIATGLWFLALDRLGPRSVTSVLEVTAYSAWIFLLTRALGLWDVTTITAGTILGSAIFVAAAFVLREVPHPTLVMLLWVVGGLITIAGARIVGVNNRNLRTLEVDVRASERLIARIPREVVAVSESGLKSADDIARLRKLGYRAFLVGERFMSEPDPGLALRRILEG